MVELAAVVAFTDKVILKYSPLYWSMRCIDEDGVDLFCSAHGSTIPRLKTIPYAPLPKFCSLINLVSDSETVKCLN